MISKLKKAQGLPLNTVVLAILVILVLVIIIVYFTTNMSKTGDSLDENTKGVNGCERGSYIIPIDKYSDAKWNNPEENDESKKNNGCPSSYVRIYSAGKNTAGEVCCAQPSK